MAEMKAPAKDGEEQKTELMKSPLTVTRSSLDVPVNSDKYRNGDTAPTDERREPKHKAVVTGKAERKKETTAQKFKRSFFGENVTNVKDYVIFDVLVPALRDTIFSVGNNAMSMVLYGEPDRVKRSKKGDENVSYASYYVGNNRRRNEDRRPRSGMEEYDQIILESRGDAENVIAQLQDLAWDYGQASVAELYDLVGMTASFTDERWGWFKGDLRGASPRRTGRGWILELPKPTRLD